MADFTYFLGQKAIRCFPQNDHISDFRQYGSLFIQDISNFVREQAANDHLEAIFKQVILLNYIVCESM